MTDERLNMKIVDQRWYKWCTALFFLFGMMVPLMVVFGMNKWILNSPQHRDIIGTARDIMFISCYVVAVIALLIRVKYIDISKRTYYESLRSQTHLSSLPRDTPFQDFVDNILTPVMSFLAVVLLLVAIML